MTVINVSCIVQCDDCGARQIFHAEQYEMLTLTMKTYGWVQYDAGGALCFKCVPEMKSEVTHKQYKR